MSLPKNRSRFALRGIPLAIAAAFGPHAAHADTSLAPVVVTATRVEQSSFDLSLIHISEPTRPY